MGFVEATLERVAAGLSGWRRHLGRETITQDLRGSFPEVLHWLEPLTSVSYPRELLIETTSSWTTYLDNSVRGTDTTGAIPFLAKMLATRSVSVITIPHTAGTRETARGRYGSLQFQLNGPRPNPILNELRSIYLSYDGDRWVFGTAGEPQPFEHLDRYKARRLRDRFTSEMLEEYCRALGIDVFDPTFYGSRAVLVESAVELPPDALSLSLEEAQAWLEITPGQEAPAVMPA